MDKLLELIKALETAHMPLVAREMRLELAKRDNALEAARLLCANLRHGGVGHARLIDNFQTMDEAIFS